MLRLSATLTLLKHHICENKICHLKTKLFSMCQYLVHPELGRYSAKSTLSEYIRDAGLTGTKVACQEAGCGACAVTATFPDVQKAAHYTTRAINAVCIHLCIVIMIFLCSLSFYYCMVYISGVLQ